MKRTQSKERAVVEEEDLATEYGGDVAHIYLSKKVLLLAKMEEENEEN